MHRGRSSLDGIPDVSSCLLSLVLASIFYYSCQRSAWKIADFGLTSPGTSGCLVTTNYSRGKPCYRAPELLQSSKAGYNAKSDIWSLGCVVYELCTGQKLFHDDFSVVTY